MTLQEYANNINLILSRRPELADEVVVYGSDDEGNCYRPVTFEPTPGYFNGYDFSDDSAPYNAVCIN